jgi:hypothetical protein
MRATESGGTRLTDGHGMDGRDWAVSRGTIIRCRLPGAPGACRRRAVRPRLPSRCPPVPNRHQRAPSPDCLRRPALQLHPAPHTHAAELPAAFIASGEQLSARVSMAICSSSRVMGCSAGEAGTPRPAYSTAAGSGCGRARPIACCRCAFSFGLPFLHCTGRRRPDAPAIIIVIASIMNRNEFMIGSRHGAPSMIARSCGLALLLVRALTFTFLSRTRKRRGRGGSGHARSVPDQSTVPSSLARP